MNEQQMSDAMSYAARARWNPQARHDSAMNKIEKAITQSQRGLRPVQFTKEDRARVVELMGGKLSTRTKKADAPISDTTSDDERQAV